MEYLFTNVFGTKIYQSFCVICGNKIQAKLDKHNCWRCCNIHNQQKPCNFCADNKSEKIAQIHRDATKKWKRKNPEMLKAQVERRKINEPTKKNYKRNFDTLFERHNGKCIICQSTERLTLDHIVPISQGGSNELENLQLLCVACNSSKGPKSMEDWQNSKYYKKHFKKQ